MNFYEQMAETSVRLLTQFGTDAILKQGGIAVLDKVAGSVSGAQITEKVVKGIVTEYNKSMVDGETILVGDKKVIIAPTAKPEVGDTITINNSTWKILNVTESNPAGVPLVYFLQVRK